MSKQSHDWRTVSLAQLVADPNDDIVDGPFGSRLKASEYVDSGIPIVRLQNIDRNRFVDKNIKFVTPQKAAEIARHHFVAGDILISKLGDPLGEACIAPDSITYGILVADVVRVRPKKSKIDTSFLAYALNSTAVVTQFEAETKGTTRPRVNLRKIRDLQIPIVESLAEQRRIVAEIEKQFARLEAGVTGLRRVQANLKRHRAAVLKAACEGKLVPTEAELARVAGHAYETGAQLLARILAERRQKWTGRGKYKEPAAPDTANLPPLPEGWIWTSVDQVADVGLGKMLDKTKHRTGQQLSYLRNINVRWGWVDTADVLQMFFEDDQVERYSLRAGDVLVCEGGEPGRAAVWDGRVTGMMYQKALHRVRLFGLFRARYLVFLLEFLAKTGRLERWFTGSTIKHFTRESFVSLPIPLPPLAEQGRIVAEVERRLSVVEELEAVLSANLQRAARLRQAILQRAFSGQLTPQMSLETSIPSQTFTGIS